MDPLFLAEVAAVATPTVATWRYAAGGRRRLREAIAAPLFWDGGQPVSLGTIHNALNGEGDLLAELAQLVGVKGRLSLPDLERAVALLQASPESSRRLIAEVAANALLASPGNLPTVQATVELLDRLAASQEALGFFSFVASLNADRPSVLPRLLPLESLVPGGFALGPPSDGEPPVAGFGAPG